MYSVVYQLCFYRYFNHNFITAIRNRSSMHAKSWLNFSTPLPTNYWFHGFSIVLGLGAHYTRDGLTPSCWSYTHLEMARSTDYQTAWTYCYSYRIHWQPNSILVTIQLALCIDNCVILAYYCLSTHFKVY